MRSRTHKLSRNIYIKQLDEKDCGPACLCSVFRYFGSDVPIAVFRELANSDREGTTAYGMIEASEALGVKASAYLSTYEELEAALMTGDINTPVIAHVVTPNYFEHYVVIYRVSENTLHICDPEVGKKDISKNEFLKQWTGAIISFEKTGDIKSCNSKKLHNLLLELIGTNKGLIAWVVTCSLVITAIGIATAFVFQYLIDNIVMQFGGSNVEELLRTFSYICLAMIFLYGVEALLTSSRGYFLAKFSNRLDTDIMMNYYNHLLDLPLGFFGNRKTGEIMSRFSDASKIREAISSITFTALIDCVMVIAGAFILLSISWKLALIAFSLFAVYVIVIMAYRNRLEENNRMLMENGAQLNSYLKESIDGIETIKTFVNEEESKKTAMNKFKATIVQAFKQSVMVNNQGAIIGFFSAVATITLLWFGANEIMNNSLSLGALITFNALLGYFLSPLQSVVGLQPEIQSALVAFDRLNDVNLVSAEVKNDGRNDVSFADDIEISNVDFRYGNRNLVLKDISLKIENGTKVAIVGESGSGKTTLSKLLMAFYEPEKGSIIIGKTNLNEISKEYLRKKISYLSQDTYLFSGTIEENIRYGNPEVSDQDFQQICIGCRVSDFVTKMPLGYNSVVEERGTNLSGGQKQRIALARVLMRMPDVLILDEATSNLDSITEQAILSTISELDKTCIIVAHRLSTISGCDKIALMENGEIIECGSREELLTKKGKFYQYWSHQNGFMEGQH